LATFTIRLGARIIREKKIIGRGRRVDYTGTEKNQFGVCGDGRQKSGGKELITFINPPPDFLPWNNKVRTRAG